MLYQKITRGGFRSFFIIFIFFLVFVVLYFLYFQKRNQVSIYAVINLIRPQNIPAPATAPSNWIPYWIDESIRIGDKEVNPFGSISSEIVEKESFEAPLYGKYVYLLIKMKGNQDRSGTLLYKNKPLSAGGVVNLSFTHAQIQGYVLQVSFEKPVYTYKTIRIQVKGRDYEPAVADAIRIGGKIMSSKGEILARVVDKKMGPAEVRADTASGRAMISYDHRKSDVEVTVDIVVKDDNGLFFFMETQKVKVNENIFLPFPDVGNLSLPIMRIVSQQPGVIQ